MKKLSQVFLLIVLASLLACSEEPPSSIPIIGSDDPIIFRGSENWDWFQYPYDQDFRAISSSEIGFIIGGGSVLTMYSGDGRSWYTNTHNGSESFLAADILGGFYLAVGGGPHGIFKGHNTLGFSITNQQETLRALACSDHIAVAVGDAGELVTSTDGRTWQRHSPIANVGLFSIVWTEENFVAGGENGSLFSSTDGEFWSVQESPIQTRISGLAATDSGLYAVTLSGGVWRKFESDWIQVFQDTGVALRGVVGYGGNVVAIGDSASLVSSTADGHWNRWQLDLDTDFRGITARERLVVIGSNNVLIVSADGKEWEERPSFPPNDLRDIASNGNSHVAVGYGIVQSVNGSDWSVAREGAGIEWTNSVSWANDHYVACGSHGVVLTSPTGEAWTEITHLDPGSLWSTHWTGSEVIIGGNSGKLWITMDYIHWEEVSCPSEGAVLGIAQSPAAIVAVTTSGHACVSTDGRNWTVTATEARFNDVIWTGLQFLALGNSSLLASLDGRNWSSHPLPGARALKAVGFDGHRVYVAEYGGRIFWSENIWEWYTEVSGFEYTEFNLTHSFSFHSFMFDGQNIFAVGDSGIILKRK